MPTGVPITLEAAQRIHELRRRGLTRYEIASRVGVCYQTVVRYSRPSCRCPRIPGVAAFFWDAGAA